MKEEHKVLVLNTPCLVTDPADLTGRITAKVRSGHERAWSVDFTNVHIVAMRKVDETFREETSRVDWFVPDSQILTWAASLRGARGNERVYGPAFLDYFVRHADDSLTHYFLGASQDCLDQLLESLKEKRPEIKVVGSHNGYFNEEEEEEIVKGINDLKPDLVWVGLGTPKQQSWIHRYRDSLDARVLLAVGFAFDVNAGTKKDAPAWVGKCGLIWLYRFICEPRRLFKRYAVYNTTFLWFFFLQMIGLGPKAK